MGAWLLVGLICGGLALVAGLALALRQAPADADHAAERREAPRRATGVPVHITSPGALPEPVAGWVLNGSATGLCLSVEQPVPRGAVLSVRPTKAPPGTPPVQVRVQRCKADARRWALGCCFVQVPPANVLALFGG